MPQHSRPARPRSLNLIVVVAPGLPFSLCGLLPFRNVLCVSLYCTNVSNAVVIDCENASSPERLKTRPFEAPPSFPSHTHHLSILHTNSSP